MDRVFRCVLDDTSMVQVAPLPAMMDEWRASLNGAIPKGQLRQVRKHGRTGRPLGDASFLGRVEKLVGRVVRPQKRGRKPRFSK